MLRNAARARATGWSLLAILGLTTPAAAEEVVPEEEGPSDEVALEPETSTVEAEPAEEVESAELTKAPAIGRGAIAGIVTETKYGEPLIEAFVAVQGTKLTAATDTNGVFRLELPPGRYVLRIAYELHKPMRTSEVVVRAGKIERVDAKLEPEANTEDVVETVIAVETQSVEGLLLERKKAAASADSIGRAEITKSNDRTAAEAARRVVGATIEDGRYLYVRGLGERYTYALLDGFPLPSPEPDRQAVPLDLFPSQVLDSLDVAKTFTPDVPGDFAGGAVRINTRRIPETLTLAGSFSVGMNTMATFAEAPHHDGGSLDFLAFDDGSRALPELPQTPILEFAEKPDGSYMLPEEVRGYARSLNRSMTPTKRVAPPNHSGNFVVSNSWDLGDDVRIGVLGALVYDRRFERRVNAIVRTSSVDRVLNDLRENAGVDRVGWGTLAGVGLELGRNHRFDLTGLYSRAADMTTTDIDGTHEERGGARIHETRMAFVSRELVFGNFQGQHTIPELGGLQIGYGLGLAAARRDQPDTRASVWQRSSLTADDGSTSDVYSFEDDSQSGMHFFADQSELSRTFKLDLTQPLGTEARPVSLKLGTLVNLRDRAFQARRFRFRPNPDSTIEGQPEEVASRINCPGSVYRADCPSRLFNGDSVERGLLVLEENTRDTDGYEAGLDVGAGYAMFDASVAPSFRVYGGPRLEVSSQTIQAFNPSTGKRADVALALDEAVLLPALGAVWSPTARVNVRASGTQTVARPQLREIAPFSFTDYFGGREIAGNPELGNTKIVNADLRTEFFPSSREVVAVSAFYKRFIDPIEQIVLNAGARGLSTFANAKGADLFGIELESRKTLDFLHPSLLPFSLVANVSFTRSRVDLTEEQAETVTNLSRPLSRSAPYMGNVSLDFEEPEWGTRVRLLYNVIGPRLVEVGTRPGPGAGIPDTYERERHLVDLTFGQSLGEHLELRAAVSNLLDSPIVRSQEGKNGAEDLVLREVRVGQTVSFGMQATY